MENLDEIVKQEFEYLIQRAFAVSADVGADVSEILKLGREQPLSRSHAVAMLTRILELVRSKVPAGLVAGSDIVTQDLSRLAEEIADARARIIDGTANPSHRVKVELTGNGSINPAPVMPSPMFHTRSIPMIGGFMKTTDIHLWEGNERLEVHIHQFRQRHDRHPSSDELLEIMQSTLKLPGVFDVPDIKKSEADDQFGIKALARSIAANGVRKAPIIDIDGTLLDGNRRVAACYYILNNNEFISEEKKRAETLYVWQLTEHATDEDRNAVVVSLNFEDDQKQEWPEYIRARKVFDEWQEMRAREMQVPNQRRSADLKRELSKRFALGPDTTVVNRYIKMVEFANEFELYHVEERLKDEYEVKHRAARYFQYFDELTKGERNGVNAVLTIDDSFRKLVFDLLYDGKFTSWKEIRALKLIHEDEDARGLLLKAHNEPDYQEACDQVERAVDIARLRSAESRSLGANTRIETFVDWLEQLPLMAFRDQIRADVLQRLYGACKLVARQAQEILGEP